MTRLGTREMLRDLHMVGPTPAARGSTRRLLGHGAVLLVAMLVAEVGIYGQLIVPRLPSVARVPLGWWAGMYLPVLLACVVVGVRLRSGWDVVVHALLAGAITQVLKQVLAVLQAPGHLKSMAVEDPLAFWTVMSARITFGFLVLFAIIHGTARWARARTR
ncbi:MAG: hypothetical protein AB2A00_06065 [Myxococcota bacterium]